jgi:cyclopropane fatty-acyl-phospholipid synthase-like methyltransferase
MIEHAQERHRCANLRYELRDITASSGGVTSQFVFSIDVLHHVRDLCGFFRAVHRMITPGGVWLAVEPNVYHPYIYCSQERMRRGGFDEDHFRPWVAEPLFRQAGFTIGARRYASVFPGAIRRLPRPLSWLERRLENWRFLGGSVVYRLQAA